MPNSAAPVAVVGVGLMGGSLGMALRRRAGVAEVRGYDPDRAGLATAVERGAIDVAADSLEHAVEGARAVFLAAPVSQLADLARRVIAATDDACVVSDVGSAKATIMEALDPLERRRFIGGHPICGAERSGVEAAREDLFEGATYFLTPGEEIVAELFQILYQLVAAIGARPVAIDASSHDQVMALVSHLPHILAAGLINQAADTAPQGRESLRSAGPSFVDLTRVGGANPPLWADILLSNADAVGEALGRFAGVLAEAASAVSRGDREWLERFFGDASAGRKVLLATDRIEEGAEPWLLAVAVPDTPGAISAIATELGHAHVNIDDLSLVPGPAGGEGELRLVVSGWPTADGAATRIRQIGYDVRLEPAL